MEYNKNEEIPVSTFAKKSNRWSWIPLLGGLFFLIFTPVALYQIGKGQTGIRYFHSALVKVLFLTMLPLALLIFWSELPSSYYLLFNNYFKHGYYDILSDKDILVQRDYYRFGSLFKVITYYDNGNLKTSEELSNGKLHGKGIFYFKNGHKRHEQNYLYGKPQGASTYFFKNGKVRLKEYLNFNIRHGKCIWFSEDGNIENTSNYVDGISANQIDEAQKIGIPVSIAEDLGDGITMKMIFIPPGEFIMGSDTGEKNEGPAHIVKITKGYYICETEITQSQWKAVMDEANPSLYKDGNNPVEMISWYGCQNFIKTLQVKTKGKYRLPTEAEWEYACRAGATTEYNFGPYAEDHIDYSWYEIQYGANTMPVGLKKANNWGLYDMHGNVFEWCIDWYREQYDSSSVNPQGPSIGTDKVFRGGACYFMASNLTVTHRAFNTPSNVASFYIGFRIVKEID